VIGSISPQPRGREREEAGEKKVERPGMQIWETADGRGGRFSYFILAGAHLEESFSGGASPPRQACVEEEKAAKAARRS